MDEFRQELNYVAFLLTDLDVSEVWLAYLTHGGNNAYAPSIHT
jgi:hypothetical protein